MLIHIPIKQRESSKCGSFKSYFLSFELIIFYYCIKYILILIPTLRLYSKFLFSQCKYTFFSYILWVSSFKFTNIWECVFPITMSFTFWKLSDILNSIDCIVNSKTFLHSIFKVAFVCIIVVIKFLLVLQMLGFPMFLFARNKYLPILALIHSSFNTMSVNLSNELLNTTISRSID